MAYSSGGLIEATDTTALQPASTLYGVQVAPTEDMDNQLHLAQWQPLTLLPQHSGQH